MLAGKHQNKSKVEVSGFFFFYVVSCPFYCSGICICPHVSLCDRKYEEMQASFELGLGRYKIDMRNRADRTHTHTHIVVLTLRFLQSRWLQRKDQAEELE